jgi:hypothetical protein
VALSFDMKGNTVYLLKPNAIGKNIVAFLELCKLGVITHWCKVDAGVEEIQISQAKVISAGHIYSLLCSYIRRTRDLQRNEVMGPGSVSSDDGTIWVSSIRFRPEHYFRLIPDLLNRSYQLLEKAIVGTVWTHVFNDDRNIYVPPGCGSFKLLFFGNSGPGGRSSLDSSLIRINHDLPSIDAILTKLHGILLLCLMMLGGGAIRWEETSRLVDQTKISYAGGTLYYYAKVWKKSKIKRKKDGDLVEHRLPKSIAPIALLMFGLIMPAMADRDMVIQYESIKKSALSIVREVFDIHPEMPIKLLDIRQFVAGVVNWAFPSNQQVVSADKICARDESIMATES